MIFRHSIFSVICDFKNFRNITKIRQRHFDAASPDFRYKSGGVEELGKALHPQTQEFTLVSKTAAEDGYFSLELMSVKGRAALFRGGQYINVLCGDKLYPFFLSSPPADALKGRYVLGIENETQPEAFAYLDSLKTGDRIITGPPVGYFYRRPLRDDGKLAVIADTTGRGAASAILSEGSAKNLETLVYPAGSDKIDSSADSFFIIGRKSFCDEISANLPDGKVHILITDMPGRENNTESFTCRVLIGDSDVQIPCSGGEPLIKALEKSGIRNFNKCRTGDCSFCRARLVEGRVTHIFDLSEDSRRKSDIQYGYIHPCRAFPDSDITLKY